MMISASLVSTPLDFHDVYPPKITPNQRNVFFGGGGPSKAFARADACARMLTQCMGRYQLESIHPSCSPPAPNSGHFASSPCSGFVPLGSDYSISGEVSQTFNWIVASGWGSASYGQLYVVSLYWAVTTRATVGYGDIHPVTTSEQVRCREHTVFRLRARFTHGDAQQRPPGRTDASVHTVPRVCPLPQVFAVIVMAVGAVIYSTLFGSMSALLATVNIKENKYAQRGCCVSSVGAFCVRTGTASYWRVFDFTCPPVCASGMGDQNCVCASGRAPPAKGQGFQSARSAAALVLKHFFPLAPRA